MIKKNSVIYLETDIDYDEKHLKDAEIIQKFKEANKMFSDEFKDVKIKVQRNYINQEGKNVYNSTDMITKVNNIEYQKELLKKFLLLTIKDISQEDIKRILEFDDEVNSRINLKDNEKINEFDIKEIKFDNFLSYGKNNIVNFNKLNGKVLVAGEPGNQSGKTSLVIDLIYYALYGKPRRCPKKEDLFNSNLPNENELNVEMLIDINGQDYIIQRTLKRNKNGKLSPEILSFYEISGEKRNRIDDIPDEDKICVNEDDVNKTNNKIKELTMSEKDFEMIFFTKGSTITNFIDLTDSERTALFKKWFGYDILDEKLSAIKEIITEKVFIKENEDNYLDKIEKSELNINLYKSENEKYCKEKEENISLKEKELKKIDEEKKKLDEIEKELEGLDINTINRNIEDLERKISYNNQKVEETKISIEEKRKDIADLVKEREEKNKIEIPTISNEDINQIRLTIKEKEREKSVLTNELDEIKCKGIQIKADIEIANKTLNELEIGKECSYCGSIISHTPKREGIENNRKELVSAREELLKSYKSKDNEINAKTNEIDELKSKESEMISLIDKKRNLEREIDRINNTIDNINNEISKKEISIERINSDVEFDTKELVINQKNKIKCENKKDEIQLKANILMNISIGENNVKNFENIIFKNLSEISKNEGRIEHETNNIKDYNDRILLIRKSKKESELWSWYKSAYEQKGIVKMILKELCPFINKEINKIIDGICDFTIKLDINEKDNISFLMIQNDVIRDIAGGSGLEQTISVLVLKLVLHKISILTKTSTVVFDEILATISKENHGNFNMFLDNLIGYGYRRILQITHEEETKNWHDHTILVTKDDKYISHIETF